MPGRVWESSNPGNFGKQRRIKFPRAQTSQSLGENFANNAPSPDSSQSPRGGGVHSMLRVRVCAAHMVGFSAKIL